MRSVLRRGAVNFNGRYYRAQTADNAPVDVPVMISAVRPRSFELAGACTDGAISWLCPAAYLRDVAVPAMAAGAKKAGQPAPPLIAHLALSVHEDWDEVETVARERFDSYMRRDPYVEMYALAGFAEAEERTWSTPMLKSLVVSGDEAEAERRLLELFSFGAGEIMVSILPAGRDPRRLPAADPALPGRVRAHALTSLVSGYTPGQVAVTPPSTGSMTPVM